MAVRPPSLRSIEAFEAAARLGSFARAADELNLTQSAVSHAVRSLEARLGRGLFERGGRMLALTADGLLLAGRVRRSLISLREAFDPEERSAKRIILRVSALASFAEAQLAPRLHAFLGANPDIGVELSSSPKLVDIGSGAADVGIRFGTGQWPDLNASLLAHEHLYPVAAPHYRGGKLPARPVDLADCDLIAHADMPWGLWFEAAGCEPSARFSALEVDSVLLSLAAASGGAGIALARDAAARSWIDDGRLVRLFDITFRDAYSYWVVWSDSSPNSAAISRFVGWLTSAFQEAPAAGRRPNGAGLAASV